jgi:hypothetical protein
MIWDVVKSAIVRFFGPWSGTAGEECRGRTKWRHAEAIKVVERADRNARIYILKRDDGLFEYSGEVSVSGRG